MAARFACLAISLAAICLPGFVTSGVAQQRPAAPPDNRPIIVQIDGPAAQRAAASAALIGKARREGWLRVIARLRITLRNEDSLSPVAAAAQARALRSLQDAVAGRALAGAVSDESVARLQSVPSMSLWVNAIQLQRLLSDLRVLSVQEDVPARRGDATQSMALINAPKVWKVGFRGKGMTVAILDSGVAYRKGSPELTHPMLAGKVDSEACFSANPPPGPSRRLISLCPNGRRQDIRRGSALNCSLEGCEHGTAVASIAAGRASAGISGVGPAASILAMQIFTKVDSFARCSEAGEQTIPCIIAYSSDLQLALDRVYLLRSAFNIAAVNLSIQAGPFEGNCDDIDQTVTGLIEKLYSSGIATVAISGNQGYDDAISWPGCISRAIAVGATTASDELWSDSNSSDLVGLLAPGVDIQVASPPANYHIDSGTSLAAPHVTGAFALLKGIKPDKGDRSVDQILNALQCTGLPVTRAGITKSRIDVWAAYQYLRNTFLEITPQPNYDVGGSRTFRILESAGKIGFTVTREDTRDAQTIFVKASLPGGYQGQLNRDSLKFEPGQATQTVTYRWSDNRTPNLWGTTRGLLSFYPTEELAQREQCPIGSASFEIVDDDFSISVPFGGAPPGGSVDVTVDRGMWDWGTLTATVSTADSEGFANEGDYIPLVDQPVTFNEGERWKTLQIQTIAHPPGPAKTFGVKVKNARGWVTGKATFTIRP